MNSSSPLGQEYSVENDENLINLCVEYDLPYPGSKPHQSWKKLNNVHILDYKFPNISYTLPGVPKYICYISRLNGKHVNKHIVITSDAICYVDKDFFIFDTYHLRSLNKEHKSNLPHYKIK